MSARDEARDELRALVTAGTEAYAEAQIPGTYVSEYIADAVVAAGYRKRPDPEITDEMEMRAWKAWSSTVGTHRMRAALEAALGVSS